LRRTAYLLCGDWHRADDVAQEALVRLYVAWPRVIRRESLYAYARQTMVRLLADHARRPWRREVSNIHLADTVIRPQASASDRVNDRVELVRALQSLSARRRSCIVLRYFSDLSVAEVARILGCAEGTVKSQTARGLEDLRRALAAAGVVRIDLTEGAFTS
jgi:RNA polymerase sigma-70 factor (sigma-E family)